MAKVDTEKLAARVKQYEGFGRSHRGEQWAKMLDLSMDSFMYYVEEKGLRIEDLYDLKSIVYKEPKKGAKMEETRSRVEYILEISGYTDYELEVFATPGQPVHQIMIEGEPVGRYFYKEGRLVLTNKEGMTLTKLEAHEVKLVQGQNGWEWHPETRAAWMAYLGV